MPRRKQHSKQILTHVGRPSIKRARGRPRKNPIVLPQRDKYVSLRHLHNSNLIKFIEEGIILMKIKTYREAIDQLSKIHAYVVSSIEYGSMSGHKKPSQEELIEIVRAIFK